MELPVGSGFPSGSRQCLKGLAAEPQFQFILARHLMSVHDSKSR